MLKLIAHLCAVVVVGLSSQAWSFDLVMDASSIVTLPVEEIEVVGKRPVRWNTWPVVWLSNGGYQVGGGGFQPMSHPTQMKNICTTIEIRPVCDETVKFYCATGRDAKMTGDYMRNACTQQAYSIYGVTEGDLPFMNLRALNLLTRFVAMCESQAVLNLQNFQTSGASCP